MKPAQAGKPIVPLPAAAEQARVLAALLHGSCLKVHRTLDGDKIYRLATPDQAHSEEIGAEIAAALEQKNLIASNMKFPAATFLLTDKGVLLATQATNATATPCGPRNYST